MNGKPEPAPRFPGTSRRALLKLLGAGAAGAALSACAPAPVQSKVYQRPYSRNPFAAPRISMDNVIRTVVGLRPYRPAGFVVRRETMDDKIVVHNYGHGGGGISLSWGSSGLAVREVRDLQPADAAVLGSGVMGLTTARLLQEAGWNVTIYTRDMWRHTTSNVAAGEWGPYSVYDSALVGPEFMAQYIQAARIAHHAFTNLTGPDYGVRWLESYALGDRPELDAFKEDPIGDLFPYQGVYGPGQHPFPSRYATYMVTMQIDPGVLLRRLTRDFQLAGGRFVIRTFTSIPGVLSLPEPVIFNCTGLGSRDLFGDEGLTAAKGQLVFFPPDPAVDYMTFGGGRGTLYMFPRSDVLLLGGTFKRDDFSRNPEADETERIVTQHRKIFSEFG